MAERERIARYFAPLAANEPGSFQLTDDAAVLMPPAGQKLVITTDSVIQGIHVLANATPEQFAQKLVRRNLSDLAAMGAKPWRYTLNVHMPHQMSDNWFALFAAALAAEQEEFRMLLAGGDSTSGASAIHVTMTCFGLLNAAPLRRNGAQIGDDLYASGTLGDAAYAHTLLQRNAPVDATLAARYHAPTPRLALGEMLRGVATAAMDISDGLLSDVTQMCAASGCGARIEQAAIPFSNHLKNVAENYRFALSGGDDYELCFAAPVSQREHIVAIAKQLTLPLTRIGSIVAGSNVSVIGTDGKALPITATGWEHR